MKKLIIILLMIAGVQLSADVTKGRAIYLSNCAICHTVNGGSAMGPDFNIVSYTRKRKDIENYVRKPYDNFDAFGYSANAMPALPLEEQEFRDVAEYIDSLQPFKKWMKKVKK